MSKEDLDMKMFAALGRFERKHGAAEAVILLNKFGVTRALDIKPEDYERVIAACSGDEAPRQSARASNDDDHEDAAPRHRPVRATAANARKPLPMETVINAAPDLKSGFDMAAKAVHARRPKS